MISKRNSNHESQERCGLSISHSDYVSHGSYCSLFFGRQTAAQRQIAPSFSSAGPTVKQLESMGHLTVLKLTLADVLRGKAYGFEGAWLVKGDALYTIDMRDCELVSKNDEQKSAVVRLPLPVPTSPRVDHSKTFTYSVKGVNWIPFTGDESKLRDESMKEAQSLIERAASQPEYVDVAKMNGELILKSMYSLVGWKIDLEWKPDGKKMDDNH